MYYYLPFPPSPPRPVSLCAAFLLVFSGPTLPVCYFRLPLSAMMLCNDAPLSLPAGLHTPLWLASLQSTALLLCVGAGALDCICFSPGPRLSLPTPLINSVLASLSPSPLSFCPGPAASHPHSNVIFFYDFSTNRTLSSPFLSSVLPLVATVLSTTWLTIHSPSYLDFNYVN